MMSIVRLSFFIFKHLKVLIVVTMNALEVDKLINS